MWVTYCLFDTPLAKIEVLILEFCHIQALLRIDVSKLLAMNYLGG
jgi:hypothetical protein